MKLENSVELIGYYGSDTLIAQAAWTSTSRELTPEKEQRVESLLEMLYKEGHHTPFERGVVHFNVICDDATHIHLLKHRIGVSINGESARYKELKEDKYYLPKDWKGLDGSTAYLHGSDSDNTFRSKDDCAQTWVDLLEQYTQLGNQLYHACLEDLTPTLGRKRAKETARYFKTKNSQIQLDVMMNMRSFAHFYGLRHSEHAQKEVYDIADMMMKKILEIPEFSITAKLILNETSLSR